MRHNHDEEFHMMIGTEIDQINPDDFYQTVGEEVEVVTRDKLTLIKLHTSLVALGIDEVKKSPHDIHLQFHVLNLLDYLFANLLPVPSLLNLVMRRQTGSRPRGLSHSVPANDVASQEHRGGAPQSTFFDLES